MCPKCGRYTEYNPERHGLCISCFMKKHKQKIDEKIKVSVVVCVGCNRLKYGKEWFDNSADNFRRILTFLIRKTSLRIYDFVISRVDEELLSGLRELKKVFIPISINIATGSSIMKYVEVIIHKALCDICSRKDSGKYYESIMHLRFSRDISEYIQEITTRFIESTWKNLDKYETVDIKREGKKGIVIRWSNRKIAKDFLRFLKEKFSVIIIKQYKEHIDIHGIKGKNRSLTVDKYILRIINP